MDILALTGSVTTIVCLYLGARIMQKAHGALSAEQLVVARDINRFTTLGFIAPLVPLLLVNFLLDSFPNNKLLLVAAAGVISLLAMLISVYQNLRKMKLAGLPHAYTSSLTKGILLFLLSMVVLSASYIQMRASGS